jgi:hypothetical protein
MLSGPAARPVSKQYHEVRAKRLLLLMTMFAALALPIGSAAATAEPSHRIELKAAQGSPLPYTIEVPADWQVRQIAGFPGLWIGPADAKPPEDPRLIWVHGSQVPLADPAEIVKNIKANDEKSPDWSAPRAEVRDLGGVKGVLWQMDSGTGDKAKSVLTLKMPLAAMKNFVDFSASGTPAEFARMLPVYERALLSVRPAPPAPPATPKKK